jgi:RimJ/RimL family protein N-acetyltransferase
MRQTFPDVVLSDGEVVLRAFEVGDLPRVVEAATDPVTLDWLPLPQPYGLATARDWCLSETERVRAEGLGLVRAIADQDGQLLGAIDLKHVDWAAQVAEVGYWTHPDQRGRGVMTRAVRLLAGWALTDQGFERIELRAATGNLASSRVAEKAGFVREGTARSAGYVPAGRVDLVVFSLIRSDLNP